MPHRRLRVMAMSPEGPGPVAHEFVERASASSSIKPELGPPITHHKARQQLDPIGCGAHDVPRQPGAEQQMDFAIPSELIELRERTERFAREDIMPREVG